MESNKGTSLVILSVTIIVLIILAGVSFAMLVGENGIFISKEEAEIKEVKEEIDTAMERIKKEAITKLTESTNLLEYYAVIDLNNYGLNKSKGYKLVTAEGKETTGITSDGVISIKYENQETDISVIGKIDFKITNEDEKGSQYGTIEKAHKE